MTKKELREALLKVIDDNAGELPPDVLPPAMRVRAQVEIQLKD